MLKRVEIQNLADLETKVPGVVVVALAVGFPGTATEAEDYLAVLQGGVDFSLVIVSPGLMLRFSAESDKS